MVKGRHLLLDCIVKKRVSEGKAREFLEKVCGELMVKKLFGPVVVRGTTMNGVTGFVVIETSHASIHCFDDEEFVAIDVYSCKDFDEKKVVGLAKEFFKPEKIKLKTTARGAENKAKGIKTRQRG